MNASRPKEVITILSSCPMPRLNVALSATHRLICLPEITRFRSPEPADKTARGERSALSESVVSPTKSQVQRVSDFFSFFLFFLFFF